MFPDPYGIPVLGNFTRQGTSNPETLGRFRNATGTIVLEVRQKPTSKQRKRRELVMTMKKIVTDPITSQVKEVSFSVGAYVDQPNFGVGLADVAGLMDAIGTIFADDTTGTLLMQGDT